MFNRRKYRIVKNKIADKNSIAFFPQKCCYLFWIIPVWFPVRVDGMGQPISGTFHKSDYHFDLSFPTSEQAYKNLKEYVEKTRQIKKEIKWFSEKEIVGDKNG